DLVAVFGVLAVSQAVGIVAGLVMLPNDERRIGRLRTPRLAPILHFGGWRAAQQGIRPGALMAFRIIVVMVATTAVFGELEAARVYTSPAMLIVSGVATYYLASYSGQRDRPLAWMVRRADIGVGLLLGTIAAASAAAFVLLPWAGAVVTDGTFDLSPVAVAGWLLYAGVSAMGVPYGSLASVRGGHTFVVWVRLGDAFLSLALVAVMLIVLGLDPETSPLGLSLGAFAGVCAVRVRLVREVGRLTEGGVAEVAARADSDPSR
ncbi:MAG: hypothetical protein U1C73_11890, partial [Dietzia sp.]|nr:hypothetical protein [Dietzia sp.]